MTDYAFYDGLAQELLGRWNRLRSFTGHSSSVGFHHEEIVRETLRSMLSPRFQLRSGFSFARQGAVSCQGDILIVDEHDPVPYLFRQGDLVVVQPRALACVIEVKTTLRCRDFVEAMRNLHSFQKVSEVHSPKRNLGKFLFAFDAPPLRTTTMDKWYKTVAVPHELKAYPIAAFVLSRGLLRLNCDAEQKVFGHHLILGEEQAQSKAKALSHFLAAVRKQVELVANVSSNPYELAVLDDLCLSRQSLHFGQGLVPTE